MSSTLVQLIPAFEDNYVFALVQDRHCVVIDPGDAEPVEAFLKKHALKLASLLITHHHHDHVEGIEALVKAHRIPVYGPFEPRGPIQGITQMIKDGDLIEPMPQLLLRVSALPGHTLGHVSYQLEKENILFVGDTLFSLGCGRHFEGSMEQLYSSLQKIKELSMQTQIYFAHEYTEKNASFALTIEPENTDLLQYIVEIQDKRSKHEPTCPTTLELELKTNPFLRTELPQVQLRAQKLKNLESLPSSLECFKILRSLRDQF